MNKLVMVIDDSLTVRKILEVTMRRVEVNSVSYVDGAEALRALRGNPDCIPGVIFLDIGLPGMDGYTIARLLRADRRFDSTVIVMLTQRKGVVDRLKARLAGATVYMTKPFRTQDVHAILARYLCVSATAKGKRLPGSSASQPMTMASGY